jgi:hypothetical protein
MKKSLQVSTLLMALSFTGCVTDMPNMFGSNLNQTNNKSISFRTNQVHFMSSLKDKANVPQRNDYLEEFLLKSDIQCQNYLNSPLKKVEVDTSKDSLYMSIFDGVSSLFGMSLVTSTAKAVFLNDDGESLEEKKAYANALSPEIRKGVEIGRSRFAKAMIAKKSLNLQAYSVNNLREDTLKYDKQCDDAYGLIEINRALKKMQSTMYAQPTPTSSTLSINPRVIKDKVEAISKEVVEKKIKKEKTKVVPTQPKLENVPVRHDNEQHLPRSIQI